MTRVNRATATLLLLFGGFSAPALAAGERPDLSRVEGEEIPVGEPLPAVGCLELVSGEILPVGGIRSRLIHLEPVVGLSYRPRSLRLDVRNAVAVSAKRGGHVDVVLRDGGAISGMALHELVLDVPEIRTLDWDDIRALELEWIGPPPSPPVPAGPRLRVTSSFAPEVVLEAVETVDTWIEIYGSHSYRYVQRVGGPLPFSTLSEVGCATAEWVLPIDRIERIDIGRKRSTAVVRGDRETHVISGGSGGSRVRRADADAGLRGAEELGTWTFWPFELSFPRGRTLPPEASIRLTPEGAPSSMAPPFRPDARCTTWSGETFRCGTAALTPLDASYGLEEMKIDPARVVSIRYPGEDPSAERERACTTGQWLPAVVRTRDGRTVERKIPNAFGWVETRVDGLVRFLPTQAIREIVKD